MGSEAFQLAILLTLKDAASGGLDRFEAKLRAAGKEGEHFAKDLDHLRSELNRDLAIGGVGLAGLKMLQGGVQVAADYQSVVTDLRATIAKTSKDGSTDFNQLAGDMMKAEVIAVNLGNALPGTTGDFVEMMQVLKQNGLQTETIMNGAAKAVAHLAVANNALPKEIAADFAQFGNIFALKPEDYVPAADVFSRIFTSTGQTAAELVEAAKMFQGRAGKSLGIGGLKDAQEMTRLFGMMGMKGLRGSQAGTMLTDFFSEYNKHADKLKDLQKETGIKLEFFDKAGKFAGLDSVFEQMKQFDKLSDKDRSKWLDDVFGLRGMSAANVFLAEGLAGWKKFNGEMDRTVSQEAKVEMKTKTFNNQMEALKGTLTNLQVAVFEPMLPGLTSAADKGNQLVSIIQLFTKDHPDLAKYAIKFLAIGSASMVAYSGIKVLTTGVQLFRLASQFSRGEGLVGYMNATSSAAVTAAGSVGGLTAKQTALQQLGATTVATTDKIERSHGRLRKISSSPITLSLQVMAAGMTIEHFLEVLNEVADRTAKVTENARAANDVYDDLMGQMKLWGAPGVYGGKNASIEQLKPMIDGLAKTMEMDRSLEFALQPERAGTFEHFWTSQRPYASPWSTKPGDRFGMPFDANVAVQQWKESGITTKMQDPNILARLITQLQSDLKLKPEANEALLKALVLATSKEKVDTALQIAKGEIGKSPVAQYPVAAPTNPFAAKPSPFSPVSSLSTGSLKIQPFDINKPMSQMFQGATGNLTQAFSPLQKPIAGTAELFSGLPQPVGDTTQNFLNLIDPVAKTTTSFGNLTGPADRLPGSFNNVFVSATGLSIGLDAVALKLSNWQPPAAPSLPGVPGVPGAPGTSTTTINPPGYAVGASSVTRSGLAFIHANEEIVPARARAYRESVHQKTIATLIDLRYQPARSDLTESNFPFMPGAAANSAPLAPVANSDGRRTAFELFPTPKPSVFPFAFEANKSPDLGYSPFRAISDAAGRDGNNTRIDPELLRGDRSRSEYHGSGSTRIDPELLRDSRSRSEPNGGGQPVVLNAPMTVNVYGGDDKAKEDFSAMLDAHARKIERLIAKSMANGRVRS